jgi:hypothetical protein
MPRSLVDFLTAVGTIIRAAALIIFGLAMSVMPAQAQPQCAPVDDVIAGLAKGYAETIRGRGIAGNGNDMLLFTDPEGDTWTLIVLQPDGTACLVASGAAWETLAAVPPGIEG